MLFKRLIMQGDGKNEGANGRKNGFWGKNGTGRCRGHLKAPIKLAKKTGKSK